MKSKHIAILVVILVALIGVYFLLQRPKQTDLSTLYTKITPEIKLNQVEAIRAINLSNSESEIFIRKSGSRWEIKLKREGEEFFAPVKPNKIEKLITDISSLTGELRASGKDVLKDFALQKGHGILIEILGKSGKIVEIIVGKKGPRWGSSFVKLKNSDKVYLVSRDLLVDFDIWTNKPEKGLSVQPWIDLQIIKETPKEIKEANFKSKKLNWRLFLKEIEEDDEKSGKKEASNPEENSKYKRRVWIFEKNGKRHQKSNIEVEEYLSTIFPLYANDILNPKRSKEFHLEDRKGAKKFTFIRTDGVMKTIYIGSCNKKGDKCYIVDEYGYLFEVSSSWIKTLENPFKKKAKAKGNKKQ